MIKKILVLGAGNMGAWFVESLCLEYDVAVYDKNISRMRYFFNAHKLLTPDEIREFNPDLLINAVSLQHTRAAFEEIIPFVGENCILSDITSVKNGLRDFYLSSSHRFVSTHPMFGPTFANVKDLSNESAIIISQSDEEGKKFFRDFYGGLSLNIYEYTFEGHDQTIAYSLSIPFSSTMVFASCMKKQEAPGTTFKKHMKIAEGLLSEDDYLLAEILFNPYTEEQVEKIRDQLKYLLKIIKEKDFIEMQGFLNTLRENIEK